MSDKESHVTKSDLMILVGGGVNLYQVEIAFLE